MTKVGKQNLLIKLPTLSNKGRRLVKVLTNISTVLINICYLQNDFKIMTMQRCL